MKLRRFAVYLLKLVCNFRPRCPLIVSVEWADLPPWKQWPSRIDHAWTVRRNATGRRRISSIICTDRWLWIGPNRIRAWSKSKEPITFSEAFGRAVAAVHNHKREN